MKRKTDFDQEAKSDKRRSNDIFGDILRSIPCDDEWVSFDSFSHDYAHCLYKIMDDEVEEHLNTHCTGMFLRVGKKAEKSLKYSFAFHNDFMIPTEVEREEGIQLKYYRKGWCQEWPGYNRGVDIHHGLPLKTKGILGDLAAEIVKHYIWLYNDSYEYSRRIFMILMAAQSDRGCSKTFGPLPTELIAKISKYAHETVLSSYELKGDEQGWMGNDYILWSTFEELFKKTGLGQNKWIFSIPDVSIRIGTCYPPVNRIHCSSTIGLPKTWSDYMILNRMLKQ